MPLGIGEMRDGIKCPIEQTATVDDDDIFFHGIPFLVMTFVARNSYRLFIAGRSSFIVMACYFKFFTINEERRTKNDGENENMYNA